MAEAMALVRHGFGDVSLGESYCMSLGSFPTALARGFEPASIGVFWMGTIDLPIAKALRGEALTRFPAPRLRLSIVIQVEVLETFGFQEIEIGKRSKLLFCWLAPT